MTAVLGISAFYHDSAAALVVDGELVAAAQEERFSRRKHDPSFPIDAVSFVLRHCPGQVDAITYYEAPWLKRDRVLAALRDSAPGSAEAVGLAVKGGLLRRNGTADAIRSGLSQAGLSGEIPLLWSRHHLSHAASAFYPSPFSRAAVLTVDGVGEWATAGIFAGDSDGLRILEEQRYPHSLGLLYSAMTYFCGFKVDSGEYKLMGLAAYGDPVGQRTAAARASIAEHLIDIRPDGSFLLNLDYFTFHRSGRIIDPGCWESLFGLPRRLPELGDARQYADLALAMQQITEEVMVRLARHARVVTEMNALCMAGGVALNCVANTRVLDRGGFRDVWIQPAAGDAGGAVGAAFAGYHLALGGERRRTFQPDGMQGAYLGPAVHSRDADHLASRYGAQYTRYSDVDLLLDKVAEELASGRVVGWVQGRLEFGPRALGNRSILADPRDKSAKDWLNARVKAREDFRPFAPSILAEAAEHYLNPPASSPYMLLTTQVRWTDPDGASPIPSATHVDGSARHHTVVRQTNERFWRLLQAFQWKTGCAALINTSFNVRGEPIVASADDAYRCFLRTGLDLLVIDDCLFRLADQKADLDREVFEPD